MTYQDFLARKRIEFKPCGFEPQDINPALFPFQQDLVRWACRRGRAALFAGTGLGKTIMELEWGWQVAEHEAAPVLVLAPLAVAQQTVREADKFGYSAHLVESDADIRPGINVTNYHKLHRFERTDFAAVVCDESSILKDHEAHYRNYLIERFASTPYRLSATATPSPNDYMELGSQAEFIGAMSRAEMLAMFFVHDGGQTNFWRLKGHAESAFWDWLCSWAALVRSPADLGYDASAFTLPALSVEQVTVPGAAIPGMLFPVEAQTMIERRESRNASIEARVSAAAEIVAREPEQPWILWCDLNAESEALAAAIPGAVEVRGSQTHEEKERHLIDFAEGRIRVLVSKPVLCGFGLNWQHCARIVFTGLSDSWEQYYQAVRRCWRFGQTRPVHVYIVTAETEGAVVANIQRKERDAARMADEMSIRTHDAVMRNVRELEKTQTEYNPQIDMTLPEWLEVA